MTPNTALTIVLAGTSLLSWTAAASLRVVARGLAVSASLVSASVLISYVAGVQLAPFRPLPAPQSAVAFLLLGAALTIFDLRTPKGGRPAPWLALVTGSIAILFGLGHLFDVALFYGVPAELPRLGVSLATIMTLITLSLGVLLARPDQGFMAQLTTDDVGGWTARHLLLRLLALAPVAALLLLGARQGQWYDLRVAAAAFVFLGVASSAWAIMASAARLNRLSEERRRSEERAQELQDEASDGIFIADLTGRYTAVNEAGCHMLGYTREEILARTILDLIPPEEASRLDRTREELLQGRVQVSEWTLRRKDGTSIPVEVSAKILPDGRWQGFVRDISERRLAESALRRLAERERFQVALGAAATPLVVVGRDGRIAYVNGQAEQFLGWSRDDLVGRPVETLIPERFRSAHVGHREGYFSSKEPPRTMGAGRSDLFILRRDGVEIPVEISLVPVEEEGEHLVVASVVDITERKKAEGALRESEERLKLFIEHAPVSLAMFDRDLRYLAVSRRWMKDYLPHITDIIGRSHYETFPQCPERWRAAHRRALAGTIVREEEDSWTMGDGRTLWARYEVRPWRTAEGAVGGIVIFTEDITERKRTEEALRKSVIELEGFAYSVAHDLRAPLRAIEGYSHFLLERLAGEPESRVMVERMSQSAVRLDRLIQDLLIYTSIGHENVQLEPVDLDSLVEYVTNNYPRLSRARFRIRKPLGKVSAQPSLLLQVLSQLLDNAVRYVPKERTPEIDLWTEHQPEGRRVLTIQDNGAGIPPVAQETIFKPFVRLHTGGDDGGTGIGLAIVRRAVERMGGRVSLNSEPGLGSRFHVELPEA